MRASQWLIVYLILAPVAIAIWLAEKIFKIKIEIRGYDETDEKV